MFLLPVQQVNHIGAMIVRNSSFDIPLFVSFRGGIFVKKIILEYSQSLAARSKPNLFLMRKCVADATANSHASRGETH